MKINKRKLFTCGCAQFLAGILMNLGNATNVGAIMAVGLIIIGIAFIMFASCIEGE